jgi:hypothetical protein
MANIGAIKSTATTFDVPRPDTARFSGVRLTLLPMDAPEVKSVKRTIRDEELRLQARGKHFKAADIETNNIKLATALLVGWEWTKDADNEQATYPDDKSIPEFNEKNVKDVLTNVEWMLTFIMNQYDDEAGFYKRSK